MATWPHTTMFGDCTKQLPALLAASPAAVQLRYYWNPGQDGNALCLPGARRAARTVLLVAVRLMHRCHAREQGQASNGPLLPDMPDELWFCILGFIRRHELGALCSRVVKTTVTPKPRH